MKVNGKVVTSSYVKQHAVSFKARPIEGLTKWPSVRSGQPAFLSPGRLGPTTCDVTLVVRVQKASSALISTQNVDLIVRQTLEKFEGFLDVDFDGTDFGFVGILKSYDMKTEMDQYWKTLTLHLEGEKVGPAEKHVYLWDTAADATFTISNPGNLPSPCRLHTQGGIYFDEGSGATVATEACVTGLMRDPYTLESKLYGLRSPWTWVHVVDARTGTDGLFRTGNLVDVTGRGSNARNVTVKERVMAAYRYQGSIVREDRFGQRFVESFGLPILMPGVNVISCARTSEQVPTEQSRGVRFVLEYRPVYA